MPKIVKKISLTNGEVSDIECVTDFHFADDPELGFTSLTYITFSNDVTFHRGDQMVITTYVEKLKEYK